MSAGKPVKISILADSSDAVAGFDKASKAAKETGTRMDSVAESSDAVASKGSQAAGALSGLGDLIGGKFGAAMQTGGIAMQAAADSGDLLNVITESNIVKKVKDTVVTGAQTTATIAKTAADKAAAAGARVWAAGQWVLNAALSANPIGLVVIAVAAFIAIAVLAFNKVGWFKDGVIAAWNGIKAATSAVWGFIKTAISTAVSVIGTVIRTYFTVYKTIITGAWNGIKAATSAVWNGIKTAVSNAVGAISGTLSTIKSKVTGAFSGAVGWLKEMGKDLIRGLINGIGAMGSALKDALVGLLPGPLKKFASKLGLASPSKLFRGFGVNIGQGLVLGVDSMRSGVTDAMSRLAAAAAIGPDGYGTLQLDASAALAGAAGATSSRSLSVRFTADQVSQLQRGREIRADLDLFDSTGGRRSA